ncbi:MAG: exonuclease domain-containing protein [Pseudomonadota bacterium]
MRQIVFDLETTGFKFAEGHRIVEIGAIEMVRGAVTRNNFHVYVNPERKMPQDAFRVHGISGKFLRDKPVFADPQVAQAFVDFIDDAELIAHNGLNFDLPFLNAELAAAGLPVLKNKLLDPAPQSKDWCANLQGRSILQRCLSPQSVKLRTVQVAASDLAGGDR